MGSKAIRTAMVWSLSVCFAHQPDCAGQSPGVPALPTTTQDYVGYAVTNLPSHFATGDVAATDNTPADNPITNAGATLGRVLFYDKRLSHNDGLSCASCHQQSTGFGDSNQFSEGFEGGLTGRHSTALSNAAYYERGRFFWDERAATLEDQVLMPIQDAVEMGTDLDQLRDELAATDYYPKLFQDAFGSTEITNDRIAGALAQFVRSMVSYQSKYDEAVEIGTIEEPDFQSVFTAQELLGQQLFHGVGRCSDCHTTHAQVAERPQNIGLDADNSADEGAGNGRFKVMSLRNAEVRGRFMHDGRFATLEEVVEFYNSGVQDNPNLAGALRTNGGTPLQLNLTQAEKNALVAFMETLTDNTFLTSDLFSDPFVDLPGDYTGDGVVDIDDYNRWKQEFGQSGDLWSDGNDDGTVNLADFTVWRDNLGRTWEDTAFGAALFASQVPEPSSALIVCLLAAAIWGVSRRRAPTPPRSAVVSCAA